MVTEHRTSLAVTSPMPMATADWEALLAELAKSPQTRGPVMKLAGSPVTTEARFTVSYAAGDAPAAAEIAISYLETAIQAQGWPTCSVIVEDVREVDLENEVQEGRL